MTAYVVAEIHVTDPEQYEEYKRLSTESAHLYGGRFIVRGGRWESLEGDWQPERLVVLAFDTVEQAKRWWDSPEYERAKAIRRATAQSRLLLVEGV